MVDKTDEGMKYSITSIDRDKAKEFGRFCITGVICTAIHYGIYLLLVGVFNAKTNWWANAAYTIGYLVGFLCNLWLSAHFTFRERLTVTRGIGFAVSNGVNYGLHLLFFNLFLWIGLSRQIAPIPTYCLVVPINFLLVRFVFKKLK